ncbi:hypothetical protein AAC387_Pa04g1774 [Persea americana]
MNENTLMTALHDDIIEDNFVGDDENNPRMADDRSSAHCSSVPSSTPSGYNSRDTYRIKGCPVEFFNRASGEDKAQRPNELITHTDVFLATHKRKDGSSSSPEVDAVITARESDRSVVESDIDNDAVAKVFGRDGKGRVLSLGMVCKFPRALIKLSKMLIGDEPSNLTVEETQYDLDLFVIGVGNGHIQVD